MTQKDPENEPVFDHCYCGRCDKNTPQEYISIKDFELLLICELCGSKNEK